MRAFSPRKILDVDLLGGSARVLQIVALLIAALPLASGLLIIWMGLSSSRVPLSLAGAFVVGFAVILYAYLRLVPDVVVLVYSIDRHLPRPPSSTPLRGQGALTAGFLWLKVLALATPLATGMALARSATSSTWLASMPSWGLGVLIHLGWLCCLAPAAVLIDESMERSGVRARYFVLAVGVAVAILASFAPEFVDPIVRETPGSVGVIGFLRGGPTSLLTRSWSVPSSVGLLGDVSLLVGLLFAFDFAGRRNRGWSGSLGWGIVGALLGFWGYLKSGWVTPLAVAARLQSTLPDIPRVAPMGFWKGAAIAPVWVRFDIVAAVAAAMVAIGLGAAVRYTVRSRRWKRGIGLCVVVALVACSSGGLQPVVDEWIRAVISAGPMASVLGWVAAAASPTVRHVAAVGALLGSVLLGACFWMLGDACGVLARIGVRARNKAGSRVPARHWWLAGLVILYGFSISAAAWARFLVSDSALDRVTFRGIALPAALVGPLSGLSTSGDLWQYVASAGWPVLAAFCLVSLVRDLGWWSAQSTPTEKAGVTTSLALRLFIRFHIVLAFAVALLAVACRILVSSTLSSGARPVGADLVPPGQVLGALVGWVGLAATARHMVDIHSFYGGDRLPQADWERYFGVSLFQALGRLMAAVALALGVGSGVAFFEIAGPARSVWSYMFLVGGAFVGIGAYISFAAWPDMARLLVGTEAGVRQRDGNGVLAPEGMHRPTAKLV